VPLTVRPSRPAKELSAPPSLSEPEARALPRISHHRAPPSPDAFVVVHSGATQRVESNTRVKGKVQLSAEAIKALDQLVDKAITTSPAVGITVLALDKNRPVSLYQTARGVAGLGHENASLAANESRLCRVASISKSVTSLLLTAMLKKRGVSLETRLLDLDIPFARHLKSAIAKGTLKNPRAWESITLHQLCNHTSGLAYAYLDAELLAKEGRCITDAEVDAQVLEMDFFRGPGGTFRYANTDYNILARVVGGLANGSTESETLEFQKLANDALFAPLGFSGHAAYSVPRDTAFLREHLTYGFDKSRKTAPVMHEANFYSGSAGLSISIDGLRKYLEGILRLVYGTTSVAGLDKQDLMQILDPEVTFDVGLGMMAYARGMYWQTRGETISFSHLGIDPDNTAVFVVYPETGIAIAVTANCGLDLVEEMPSVVRAIADSAHDVVAKDIASRVAYVVPLDLKALASRAKKMITEAAAHAPLRRTRDVHL
jgi:CubicO group peptidase (beta-lactamase class C family)